MKKALITASVFGFIGSFEKSNINILLEQGYEVHVASNMSKDLKAFGDIGQLDGIDVTKHQISYSRSPLSLQTIKSYKAIKKLIMKENFDLIHCHTPVAAMLTRFAAKKVRKKGTKVIYTAHGFHFFKGAPILNWLIYFPVEYICSFFTDVLITINQEDYQLAQKVMKTKLIEYVPGVGINIDKFKNIEIDKAKKRKEIGVPENSLLLLSVGELNHNKNHQIIIESLANIKDSTVHYCIAGQGELEEYLKNKAKSLGIENQVHLIGFRRDIAEIYQVADIFCFPSHREGLSVALMEAMAVGLPVICSDIRGNVDLITEDCGYRCNSKSVAEFSSKINKLIKSNEKKYYFSQNNMKRIRNFSIDSISDKMTSIYCEVLF